MFSGRHIRISNGLTALPTVGASESINSELLLRSAALPQSDIGADCIRYWVFWTFLTYSLGSRNVLVAQVLNDDPPLDFAKRFLSFFIQQGSND